MRLQLLPVSWLAATLSLLPWQMSTSVERNIC